METRWGIFSLREALSSLLNHAEQVGTITGVPISPKSPKLNHLFFADDSLIFCKANFVEWRRVLGILDTYEEGSGQKLNFQKTTMSFSINTSAEKRQEILNLSGLSEQPDTILISIKSRVEKKLSNWKIKFLSQARK
jgi:hypothetical protein